MCRIPRNTLNLGKGIFQRMTVVRIAMERYRSNKPASPTGCRNTDLASKLVALVCLPLADAFRLRFMNTVDLVLIVSLLGNDSLCSH